MSVERSKRSIDVVVFGATGTTGSVMAELLGKKKKSLEDSKSQNFTFAIAGRNQAKLKALKEKLGLNCEIIVADCAKSDSMLTMAKQTKVILTAAGPYYKYGESVMQACILAGTHYCDITGEAAWVGSMTEKYGKEAKDAKSCLVSFAGVDCVPYELAISLANDVLGDEYKVKSAETLMVAKKGQGGAPPGTLLTLLNLMKSPWAVVKNLIDTVNFVPKSERFSTILSLMVWMLPLYSRICKGFTLPNPMGLINIPVIHRTASNMGFGGLTFYDRMPLPKPALWNLYHFPTVIIILSIVMIVVPIFLCYVTIFGNEGLKKKVSDSKGYKGFPDMITGLTARVYGTRKSASDTSNPKQKVVNIKSEYPGDPGVYCTSLYAIEISLGMAEESEKISSGFSSPVMALGPRNLSERLKNAGCTITWECN
mmetsp:Transcript_3486/g.5208  ORF Transcript_3486/g.5208 Transcript_3486/m.5208 type:complete len:425 (+) Transcript_3486:68-1342(+)